jgi:hypothetical protein
MRLAGELASTAVAITVSAIVGALVGLVRSVVGHAIHPYAVVIACAAVGAVGVFVVLGRPPSQRPAVDLLLAVNVAAFVVLRRRNPVGHKRWVAGGRCLLRRARRARASHHRGATAVAR